MKRYVLSLFLLATAPLCAAEPRRVAKSVIEIWVWGGPSQLETFDPKPEASTDYNNGLKAIPTNVPGISISEWLPLLARHADKYSLVRTLTHPYNGHETATYLMQTGRVPGGGRVYPAIGAVVAMFKAKEYKGELPPYIILTVPKGRFSEVGFLDEVYAPLVTGGNPARADFSVDGISAPGGSDSAAVARRFALLAKLDAPRRAFPGDPVLAADDAAVEEARRFMSGTAAKVFDLASEPEAERERYGKNAFGQSCLLARRLVAYGVPYVTINAQGWDSHKRHFETMKSRTAELDKALSALLDDLEKRGLLDTTIVFMTGEFGRTPRIDRAPPWNGGRNHYARCFSALVAGGGFAGGRVVGVSDAVAGNVVSRPVAPQDFLGSIYELCGIDPDGPLPNARSIDATVLPPASRAGRLCELYREAGE